MLVRAEISVDAGLSSSSKSSLPSSTLKELGRRVCLVIFARASLSVGEVNEVLLPPRDKGAASKSADARELVDDVGSDVRDDRRGLRDVGTDWSRLRRSGLAGVACVP